MVACKKKISCVREMSHNVTGSEVICWVVLMKWGMRLAVPLVIVAPIGRSYFAAKHEVCAIKKTNVQ